MRLTPEQVGRFKRDGYLFFASLFSTAEMQVLSDEVPRLFAQRRPASVREKDSEAVRTDFEAHLYSGPFARLARHPRLVEPIMQRVGVDVYMDQGKINGQMA